MSGHSKWSTIKHKKGRVDAKRGQVFTRLIREITVAARMGGGDVNGNPRLRSAVLAGRAANMPSDNIERGIKRGTGELDGVNYEEILYEGYGPAGVAVLVETVTDNKTRTVAEIRHTFAKYGGSIAQVNAVAWQFERVGRIVVDREGRDEDEFMMLALEAGADDLETEEDTFVVQTSTESLFEVQSALEAQGIKATEAILSYVAKTPAQVPAAKVASLVRLLEALDDSDDVQTVHTNADLPDDEDGI